MCYLNFTSSLNTVLKTDNWLHFCLFFSGFITEYNYYYIIIQYYIFFVVLRVESKYKF